MYIVKWDVFYRSRSIHYVVIRASGKGLITSTVSKQLNENVGSFLNSSCKYAECQIIYFELRIRLSCVSFFTFFYYFIIRRSQFVSSVWFGLCARGRLRHWLAPRLFLFCINDMFMIVIYIKGQCLTIAKLIAILEVSRLRFWLAANEYLLFIDSTYVTRYKMLITIETRGARLAGRKNAQHARDWNLCVCKQAMHT